MVVLEDVGGGARVVMLQAVLSVRQFDYKVYVVMWRREVLAEASQRTTETWEASLHIH
jgi:hypothetical protein